MTRLESSLLTALVDAAFWGQQGQPERADTGLVLALSAALHHRAATGAARTITLPSKINKP